MSSIFQQISALFDFNKSDLPARDPGLVIIPIDTDRAEAMLKRGLESTEPFSRVHYLSIAVEDNPFEAKYVDTLLNCEPRISASDRPEMLATLKRNISADEHAHPALEPYLEALAQCALHRTDIDAMKRAFDLSKKLKLGEPVMGLLAAQLMEDGMAALLRRPPLDESTRAAVTTTMVEVFNQMEDIGLGAVQDALRESLRVGDKARLVPEELTHAMLHDYVADFGERSGKPNKQR